MSSMFNVSYSIHTYSACKAVLESLWSCLVQDVNSIPAEVIKQHSLSSSTQAQQPRSSSNGTTDSSSAGLPDKLQQLNLAASSGADTRAVSPHTSQAVQPGTAVAAEVQNGPSHCQPDRTGQAPTGDAPHQAETSAPSSADTQAGQGGAADRPQQDQQHSSGQASGAVQPAEATTRQTPVPSVSIAGWDESPVSVSRADLHCSCLCGACTHKRRAIWPSQCL